jgi:chromosome condensin MukBEF MukE localization factor
MRSARESCCDFPTAAVILGGFQAEKCDQVNFKERGITHLLLLGLYRSSQFNKTVQLRIATQDVDTYNMYTHLEKIHAFIDAGRRLGKVLVVDHTGKGECLFVFCAELMRMGFTFDDAERIMRR